MKTLVAIPLLAPLLCSFVVGADPESLPDTEACKALGFTPALSCSTCESIEDIVSDEGAEEFR